MGVLKGENRVFAVFWVFGAASRGRGVGCDCREQDCQPTAPVSASADFGAERSCVKKRRLLWKILLIRIQWNVIK